VPIRTILVGVDFSPAAEVAGRQAIGVARRTGARVVLAHAAAIPEEPEGLPSSMAKTAHAYLTILRNRVAEDRVQLEQLVARLGTHGVDLSSSLVDGFADEALVTAARDLSADLLVAGSHGHRGLGRALLGGVVEHVVRMASCPVLVTRGAAEAADDGYKRVLVATDFSDPAERGLDLALEMVAAGGSVELVHFWQMPVVPRTHARDEVDATLAEVRAGMEQHGRQRGADALAARDTSRVQVRYALREGDTRDGIVDLARIAASDLVVIGSHGRRGLRRFKLGSVAEYTVRHAPCSVLVAR